MASLASTITKRRKSEDGELKDAYRAAVLRQDQSAAAEIAQALEISLQDVFGDVAATKRVEQCQAGIVDRKARLERDSKGFEQLLAAVRDAAMLVGKFKTAGDPGLAEKAGWVKTMIGNMADGTQGITCPWRSVSQDMHARLNAHKGVIHLFEAEIIELRKTHDRIWN